MAKSILSRRQVLKCLAAGSVAVPAVLSGSVGAAEERIVPPLPYARDALKPHLSAETLTFHHDKHHAGYVAKLNQLIAGTPYENQPLEEIVRKSDGAIYNNAAQVWNHTFYWNCLSPEGGGEPAGPLAQAIQRDFGSPAAFQEQFTKAATGVFGSGWAWLVKNPDNGRLEIVATQNAGNPLTEGRRPLLTCDVWEHAYYLDYQNRRADYVAAFWKMVNWPFVASQYEA